MKKQHSFVMGAFVAAASMAVGAGTMILVNSSDAFSGSNPNSAADTENAHIIRDYNRNDVRRRDAGVFETTSYVNDEQPSHAAATSNHNYTVGELIERCLDLGISRIRLSHCISNAREGLMYQFNQENR
ncbi:hypothetical protein A2454_03870 [Candidatus Peribacteria bacterium RIFOXYC2_FULL_55_14]|nr:MAG: hypothetical protein UY87_C0055G0002 [Candidatus Peribacteria bacterium GW2011_GWC2_54_8]KKW40429.1 MAG: hypothetical protein UY90_C0082G0010 [Candidatus Peregrinibacteria bacterium GW2011_GWA2_54_9]OGJ71557.1 MAG: hypothetical protein A2198_05125 [Candidatus Peribacteria bacterium RIFOXYA1_FULL_56_14]OGJ72950.1 MAG: hypothetical protein A2217_06635 [Candidatus Peribacteria bacterium RIFOXYA2_FULL_55_28]OGJ73939.1 MAG: hypothetical protein A2384_04905 [Candidatus Peribacteria bacterium 